ncbi:uncharacterized protein B0T15DRAFT_513560 [Chaetomium strumarium]|uniref:Uncharacterized protein n=1 Tax=Chaetomium strumarium TaxID=1170767 RepID=A0AAJ0GNU1_9PEZI|nr:hypothetical protein B0T15DRAFT_513560 [Chaetomium strumarium]
MKEATEGKSTRIYLFRHDRVVQSAHPSRGSVAELMSSPLTNPQARPYVPLNATWFNHPLCLRASNVVPQYPLATYAASEPGVGALGSGSHIADASAFPLAWYETRSSAVLIDEITEHRSSGPGAQKSRLTAILSAYPKLLGIWNSVTLQYPLSGSENPKAVRCQTHKYSLADRAIILRPTSVASELHACGEIEDQKLNEKELVICPMFTEEAAQNAKVLRNA